MRYFSTPCGTDSMFARLLFCGCATILLTLCPLPAAEETPAVTPAAETAAPDLAALEKILQEIPENGAAPVWAQAQKLAALGEGTKEALEKQLPAASPARKIAIGYALMATGWQREGENALEEVILDTKAAQQRRIEAAAVLGKDGGEYAKARLRVMLQDQKLDEMLKIELAKSLWKLSYDSSASEILRNVATKSENQAARTEAALALGRFGLYDLCRTELTAIAQFPGKDGDEARTLRALDEKNQKNVSRDAYAQELIGEVVDLIRTQYAYDESDPNEAEQFKAKSLASAAARALARSLDDFNDYLDEEDYQEMLNGMRGDYGGIGAYVGMRDNYFTVLTPMWGKPAQKAGLQAMDIITKIDGDDITGLELNNIIKKLKGKPGTIVKVTVVRKGWDEPHEFAIRRDLVIMPMIYAQKLPGGIGYIRLTGFQDDPARRVSTSSELKDQLLKFEKDGGIKGLILDLRNNPGGLLTEAVGVCESFLERNKLVVYSKGKVQPRRNYTSRILGTPVYTGPVVVLVNGGSASASEIVSGALRDHKRATLVGTKTYGKGSVQQLLPIESTDGNTRLKLTIAKYYLPSGECIHGRDKGIKPHIEVEEEKLEKFERELRIKDMENRDFSIWLEQNFDQNKEKYMSLLEYDGKNPEAYPEFDKLFEMLKKKYPEIQLTKEMVRQELRSNLYAFLRESRGIEDYPADVESSEVLQRGILALGEKIGGLPDIALYNSFKEKWKEEDKKLAAANAAKDAAKQAKVAAAASEKTTEPQPAPVKP